MTIRYGTFLNFVSDYWRQYIGSSGKLFASLIQKEPTFEINPRTKAS